MSIRRLFLFLLVAVAFLLATGISTKSNNSNGNSNPGLIVGRNVNMVAGQSEIDGDPFLQRQNEPSIAVSTRNPMHLLAGSNDYRAVDYVDLGELPGQVQLATENEGDAWLGVFKSFNGGQTWITTLLPGCKYDLDDPGTSPLYGYGASTDPTVRAGPNGLFYYSGIAFDRIDHGRSALFVARYTDNNTTKLGDTDPIKYIDTSIVDEGTSGQFADKPWIAVDIPRNNSPSVPISGDGIPDQLIPAHNVYIVYSIFLGDLKSKPHNKILFARSRDCAGTFEHPIKLSEGEHISQGTTIAVSPLNGDIYVAWRRFKSDTEDDSIMVCKSEDYGSTFTKPTEVRPITPFDQFTGNERFRTSAFPTLAVDHAGTVYVAWSDRGFKDEQEAYDEHARIVISTSTDGIDWSDPKPIDVHIEDGHQIMPSLTFAAGKLMMTWFDTRNSPIDYPLEIYGEPQTMDVRVAQALPSSNPSFTSTDPLIDSTQVSRYLYDVVIVGGAVTELEQVQFNNPNYEMFVGGTYPFHGDYIDITPAPMFLFDVPLNNQQEGRWRFNTGEEDWDPSGFHVTWTDNRDVIPPNRDADPPIQWWHYRPPYSGCIGELTTGMRNQNIYTASITEGIIVGAPVNTKQLPAAPSSPDPQNQSEPAQQKATFLVFVKNLTDVEKHFRLKIETPSLPTIEASFWEEDWNQGDVCPFISCDDEVVDLSISPHSSTTLTVFVAHSTDPLATFRVKVEEIEFIEETGWDVNPNGFLSYIILNPDPTNTQFIDPADEYHTPTLITEGPVPVILSDPTMLSAQIVYDPYLEELLNYSNPDIVTPGLRHPGLRHDTVINPGLRHTAVGNIPEGQVTDLNWTVTNNNDATSAYSFEPIGEIPDPVKGVEYQLLIYRVNTTPATATPSEGCILSEEEHHELLLTVQDPGLRHPGLRHPGLRHPGLRHNTFFLAPGETAICTLRVIAPTSNPFDPEDYATTVAGAAIPQATNPDGTIDFASSLYIIAREAPENPLPTAWVNDYYETYLEAYGGTPDTIENSGTPDEIWKYVKWRLKDGETLPSGLYLDDFEDYGKIYGTPQYNPTGFYPKEYSVIVELEDESPTPQIARREFKITIDCEFHDITVKAHANGSICYPGTEVEECIDGEDTGSVTVPHGESMTFAIKPITCFHVNDVKVDGVSKGSIESYAFTDAWKDYKIEASFAPNTYTITTIAGEGGSICHSVLEEEECIPGTGEVNVTCGETKKFTVSVDEGYMLEDIIVDYVSKGPITPYTFTNITSDHRIETVFKKLQKWVERYNNDPVNGNDEANDIAVDLSNNNVYVTGYSLTRNKGEDFYTISYNSDGVKGLRGRYDGPAHKGDFGNAIAVDSFGNVSVTGQSFRGMKEEHSDYCTIQYNSSEELVWDARYDARRNGHDVPTAVAMDLEGNVYITGRSEYSLSTKSDVLHYDFFTIKYNADNGRIAWDKRYDNTGVENAQDEAVALAVDSSRNVYVTGKSEGNGTGFDIVTIKYDSEGNEANVVRYDNNGLINGNDQAAAIALDLEENIYVAGFSSNGADNDIIIIKYHPDLSIDTTWGTNGVVRYDSDHNDEATAIAVHSSGNVYVTGYSWNDTNNDYITIMYDSSRNELWARRYNNNGIDEAADIAVDAAGNAYVTGRSQAGGDFDYYTIKYDSSGNMVWQVRYDNTYGDDEARALVLDSLGNVYVTGRSQGMIEGVETGFDYATIKYEQQPN